MGLFSIMMVTGCAVVSLLLLRNLWLKQKGTILKKIFWSVIVCIPLGGWIFYGGFYDPPGSNSTEAEGKACGWAPLWPKK